MDCDILISVIRYNRDKTTPFKVFQNLESCLNPLGQGYEKEGKIDCQNRN